MGAQCAFNLLIRFVVVYLNAGCGYQTFRASTKSLPKHEFTWASAQEVKPRPTY